MPGVGFAVLKNGQLTARGFGVSNLDNPQPITPDTIFALASISKTVTTTAMMRLVEQGKVDLNAPVKRYLPDFKVQDETTTNTVAIWHLLTHTPGWEGQLTAADRGSLTLANFIESIQRAAENGGARRGLELQQRRVQRRGPGHRSRHGQSIHEAFRSLVFEPIGLTRAFTQMESLVTYPFSVAHRGAPRPGVREPAPVAIGVGRRGRRLHEPQRPDGVREVPSRRRHGPRRQARALPEIAGIDAHAESEEERGRRRDGTRLASAAGRRRDDGGARRHARPLPARSSSCPSATLRWRFSRTTPRAGG